MKRRFYSVLICCVILFLLTIPAYAAGTKEYILDEIGMTVSMPSDYVVFSRDINANDPNLSAYGLTKDGITSLMSERNIYLNGWDADVNQEIIITMIDSPLVDFNLYSDTTLSIMATSLESEYENFGVTLTKSEIYHHTQAKFLKMNISQPNGGSTMYGLQYHTVYADKAINITMQSYSGQITATQEAVIKSIVDSVEFDTAPQTTETNSLPTGAFTYTDTKTNATFLVPANWVETPLTEEREFIDVQFTSLKEDGMVIMYGGFDLWNEMTTSERSGYTRSDIDNSIFTKSDIADAFGLASNDVKSVTYGGKEYYTATVTSDTEAYGLNFAVTMTHMVCVENGYMHWFQFSGADDNELYGDFESLLTSVGFSTSDNTRSPDVSSDPSGQFSLEGILLNLVVTIAVYSLPIIIYRYFIRKAPVEREKAKKITIIYGICAFIVMSVIIFAINGSGAAGGAILLWSWINYRMLIGGENQNQNSKGLEPVPSAITPSNTYPDNTHEEESSIPQKTYFSSADKPNEIICQNCGASLSNNSKFCHKCGAQIQK